MKRLTVVLLVILTVALTVLTACGGESVPADETAAAATSAVTDVEVLSGRPAAKDSVPNLDLGGRTYTVMIRNDMDGANIYKLEYDAEEENGDVLNDAVYARNRYVEERLNCEFTTFGESGVWSTRETYMNKLNGFAMAGDDSIDFTAYYGYCMSLIASAGSFYDLNDGMGYIELEQPWWFDYINKNVEINGHRHIFAGEVSLSTIYCLYGFGFNKRLAELYLGDKDLYQIARDGKWTFDEMIADFKLCYNDADGDGVQSVNDIYGWSGCRGDVMIHAADVTISTRDDNGVPQLGMNDERMAKLVATLQPCYSDPAFRKSTIIIPQAFESGKQLFYSDPLRSYLNDSFRSMEDDYGMLPMPKLTEDQDIYKNTLEDIYSALGILISCSDYEGCSAVIELLGAESYRSLTSVFYETVMKVKLMRDEDAAEMLDLIVSGVEVDITEVYAPLVGSPVGNMRPVLEQSAADYASKYASLAPSTNAKLADLYENFGN